MPRKNRLQSFETVKESGTANCFAPFLAVAFHQTTRTTSTATTD